MDKIISFITVIVIAVIFTAVGTWLTHATGWYVVALFIFMCVVAILGLRAIAVALYDSRIDGMDTFTYDKKLEDKA